jgi:hypothetical protein
MLQALTRSYLEIDHAMKFDSFTLYIAYFLSQCSR